MTAPTFTQRERDKLIVALMMESLINRLNHALAVHKAQVTFDYSNKLNPQVWIQTPNCQPELWFTADHQRRKSYGFNPKHPELYSLVQGIIKDLATENGYLMVTTHRAKNQKIQAKFQIHFRDLDRVVITLFSAVRGQKKTQHMFLLPKELRE